MVCLLPPAHHPRDTVWMGVSVERSDYTFRIDQLRQTGALGREWRRH